MLTQSKNTDKELDLSEDSVEVEVGTDAAPIGRLVFPPIRRLLQDVDAAKTKVNPAEAPTALVGAELELARLLRRHSEFQDSAGYLAKASRLALACGKLDTARMLANQAVGLNAPTPSVRYRLAEALLQSEELHDAEKIFRDLAESGHLKSCLRLTEVAIRQGDSDSAAYWLQRASMIDQTDWRVQAVAGTLALLTGGFVQAVRHFRNSIEGRPRSVRLHYDLALAHILTGHLQHALTALRRAMGLDPLQRRTLVAWSDLSTHLGKNLPEVARALSRYLRFNPSDLPTVNRLAYVLREQGDSAKSYRLLSQARRNSDDPRTANNLGVLAAERKKLPQAVKEFSRALELLSEPKDDEEQHLQGIAMTNLMGSLIEARSFQSAIETGKSFAASIGVPHLLSKAPEFRVADWLIEALMETGAVEEAMQLAEAWVDAPGINARLEAGLSEKLVCYFTLERVNGQRALEYAVRAYRIHREFKPRDPVKYAGSVNNLAFALIEMGKHEEAANYLSQLQPLPPPYGAFGFATRGLLALRTGKFQKGQELYQRAIETAERKFKNQLRKKFHWELATYWRKHGDPKKSRQHLARVLKTPTDSMWKLRHLDAQAEALFEPTAR